LEGQGSKEQYFFISFKCQDLQMLVQDKLLGKKYISNYQRAGKKYMQSLRSVAFLP